MSGVLSISLSSTPPLATPSPVVRGSTGKRGAAGNVVSFRSGLPEDGPLGGSLKNGGLSRSLTEGPGAASLGRSLSRSRTASGEGLPAGSSAAPASAARPLHSTKSIPKSAAFVKIEGFDTAGFDAASPAASPPPSPQQPRTLSSLLSRQLSTDRLPGLAGSPGLASPLASPGMPEEHLGGLVSRLEAAVRVAPVPRPAPLHPARRGTVPDNLLKQLQVGFAFSGAAFWVCLLSGRGAMVRAPRVRWCEGPALPPPPPPAARLPRCSAPAGCGVSMPPACGIPHPGFAWPQQAPAAGELQLVSCCSRSQLAGAPSTMPPLPRPPLNARPPGFPPLTPAGAAQRVLRAGVRARLLHCPLCA